MRVSLHLPLRSGGYLYFATAQLLSIERAARKRMAGHGVGGSFRRLQWVIALLRTLAVAAVQGGGSTNGALMRVAGMAAR